MIRVSVAGSTGSIGTQTLEVLAQDPERFEVYGIAASGRSPDVLVDQARATRPKVVAVTVEDHAEALATALPEECELRVGADAAESIAREADVCINGVVGFAGLGVTLATLETGRRLGLANKESLIAAGPVVQAARRAGGGELVPVDSEHAALHQCLRSGGFTDGVGRPTATDRDAAVAPRRVDRLVLTASGGPFRGRSRDELSAVTVADALAHPTWSMGPKITVDSSTLMNKGLEVIEAHLLFGVPYDDIEVVVHPQSIVHSMVEFIDGSTIAQASPPDMRLPISLGLDWPHRVGGVGRPLDWRAATSWTFEPLDEDAFPAVALAKRVGTAGRTYPAVFNAANEQAVDAFHDGRLTFPQIVETVERVVEGHEAPDELTRESLAAAEAWARAAADRAIAAGR